jgi:hypothetical protein
MSLEGTGVAWETPFTNRAHQVKTSAWSIVFIASDDIGRTCLKTEAAMNAGEQLLLLMREHGRQLRLKRSQYASELEI